MANAVLLKCCLLHWVYLHYPTINFDANEHFISMSVSMSENRNYITPLILKQSTFYVMDIPIQ